ncbi:MAG: NADH-quinone oxidoreductase subunit J [Phycisphaerae bacterium]
MGLLAGYWLYGIIALGAAGLYLASPRGRERSAWAGGIVALAAVALLLVELARRFQPGGPINGYFYSLAAVAILAAGRVVTHPRPVYAALYLVVVVLAVAGLLLLLDAEFLAAALVIIYAGAILVTYVVVIMLAQQPGAPQYDWQAREPAAAVTGSFVLTAAIAGAISNRTWSSPAAVRSLTDSNTLAVGNELLSTYAVALELAGVLLLVAITGAILIALKRPGSEASSASASREDRR